MLMESSVKENKDCSGANDKEALGQLFTMNTLTLHSSGTLVNNYYIYSTGYIIAVITRKTAPCIGNNLFLQVAKTIIFGHSSWLANEVANK